MFAYRINENKSLSVDEFQKYRGDVNNLTDELNKKPEEFELKYIVADEPDEDSLLNRIIETFQLNGFTVESTSEKENDDEYYDTRNFDLYKKGGSLRIRKEEKKGKKKIKATYKMPLEKGEVYSSRKEIEEPLEQADFETFKQKMLDLKVDVNFDNIVKLPILNSRTKRIDVLLDKNGKKVCLSFDKSIYTNHMLNDLSVTDRMIEIEAKGELNNRIILNEIYDFITPSFPNLHINKQSKYERGVNKTLEQHNKLQEQENPDFGTLSPNGNEGASKLDINTLAKRFPSSI